MVVMGTNTATVSNVERYLQTILVLNLPLRDDRRSKVREAMGQLGLDFQFVDGVTHSNPKLGCLLGHLQAINTALLTGAEHVLILEDDVVFHPDFLRRFNALDLRSPWQVLWLGCQHISPPKYAGENLVVPTMNYDNHAKIFSRKGLMIAEEVLTSVSFGEKRCDVLMKDNLDKFVGLSCLPNLVWQAWNPSSILGYSYSSYHTNGRQKLIDPELEAAGIWRM